MVRHDAGDILRSVLGPAMRLVAVGIVIGVAGAVLATGAEKSPVTRRRGTPRLCRWSGDAIPLAARIVAVADVYDALTHARPYRSAWKRDRVIAELRRKTGTHFDPQVVEAFLEAVVSDRARKTVWSAA